MFLPLQYFHAAAHPFQGGVLTLVPFIGALGLIAGCVIGILQQRRELLLFFSPFIASQCYVTLALFFDGRFPGDASLLPLCMFIFPQIALIAYIAHKLKGARLATLGLTVFSLSYTWLAYLVGQMAWTDTWL